MLYTADELLLKEEKIKLLKSKINYDLILLLKLTAEKGPLPLGCDRYRLNKLIEDDLATLVVYKNSKDYVAATELGLELLNIRK